MNKKKSYKNLLLYVLIVYAISFGAIWIYDYFGGTWEMPWSLLIGSFYMFFPFISASIVIGIIEKKNVFKEISLVFTFNRWFIIAWLLPFGISGILFFIMILMPNVKFSPDVSTAIARLGSNFTSEQIAKIKEQFDSLPFHPVLLSSIQAILFGPTVNAFFAFGEEAGWRGLMHRELKKVGFWKESIIIGLVWGFWHMPLILKGHNYPQHPVAGVFMMVAFTLLLSIIMTYILIKSGSLLTAAIFHGTINATAGLPLILFKGGNDLTVGFTGLAGLSALLITIILLVFYDRFYAKDKLMFK